MLKKRKSLFVYELAITKETAFKNLGFTVVYRRWLRWPRRLLGKWHQAQSRWVPFELLNPTNDINTLRGAYFASHEHALQYVGEVQLSGRLRHRRKSRPRPDDRLPIRYAASETTRFKFNA